jgi:DNA repair exonuclease SbcCD ATPase subunit
MLLWQYELRMASEFESSDELDKAGQSILRLVQRAAGTAEHNSRQALEAAQDLSQRLTAAHDRIAELEGDVEAYRERAERAEAWLDKIRAEIDQQFPSGGRAMPR